MRLTEGGKKKKGLKKACCFRAPFMLLEQKNSKTFEAKSEENVTFDTEKGRKRA